MGRQSLLPPSLAPIGGGREVAAAYVSLSATTFQALVDQGIMPKPKRAGARLIWDLEEVRRAFKAMPTAHTIDIIESANDVGPIPNEWDVVLPG